ncbi:hypothetical protein COOONC_20887 [Cooperia oncophora]
MQCLQKAKFCDTHNLFKTASSSVTKMCGERRAVLEKMKPCLAKFGDATAQLCDNRCHGRANVTAFLNKPAIIRAAKMGGNIIAVNDNLGSLCRTFSLQPMESVADLLLKASPTIKDFVAKKMDKRCRFAIQKSEIMKMRKGQFNH